MRWLMNKLPILMTASVSTRGMRGADFSDPEREAMYIETIKYYVSALLKNDPERKIVFVDNSGWDLGRIKAQMQDMPAERVEFISLDVKDFDVSKGKGYNETILINQAIERSHIIRSASAFLKVTGRYPIFNIGYYLCEADAFIGSGGQFYGDIKDHKLYDILFPGKTGKWNGHAAYTVLFATTVDFWKEHLFGLLPKINDYTGDWIECVWYRELIRWRYSKDERVRLRFRREPICGGLQGSICDTFAFSKDNNSLKTRIMRFIGNCIRTVTPWFWF